MRKINAQTWLQKSNKDIIKVIGRNQAGAKKEEFLKLEDDEELEGELKINGFSSLQIIDTAGNKGVEGFLTKVTISDCSNL
jgi:hypothetical protein